MNIVSLYTGFVTQLLLRNWNYVKAGADGNEYVDWEKMKTVKWNDPKIIEAIGQTDLILPPDDRIFGKKEIDPSKLIYHSEIFDLKEAAKRENASQATF